MEVIVRRNDSLWHYSQLFDIPLVLILHSNPEINPAQLTIGAKVTIPGYKVKSYILQQGDHLSKIAIQENIPVDTLYLLNPHVDPTNLQPGQKLLLPERITQPILQDFSQYTYEKMVNDLEQLIQLYPFIVKNTIGYSVMGKELIELQVGSGNKIVHVNGSFHANEWLTTPIIMKFLNEYALGLTNRLPVQNLFMLPLYFEATLSLVPMVNPDGVNLVIEGVSAAENFADEVLAINQGEENFLDWKANIRGVDLNNQFPAGWQIEAERKPKTPQPRDYPGTAPLTEPESIAMAKLTNERQFAHVNAFHTQGEVIFWGFEGLEPPYSEVMVQEYERVSGYEPIQYVDSFAGYKDWFIQDFRRPGFTIELGRGKNPLPISQFSKIYNDVLGVFLANLYM